MTEITIPAAFAAKADTSGAWAAWLSDLPRLVRDLMTDWRLRTDGSATHGAAALVVPVRTVDGVPAMLKVGWPHEEAEHEHLALRAWNADGAVRLLRADPRRWALLLERAAARDLNVLSDLEACEVVAGLYPRLHRPAVPQLRRLSELTGRWGGELSALGSDSAAPHRLVEQAASLCRTFADDPGTDGALLHTDLHFDNVLESLRDDGDRWLVIDPKPLSGDPHFEVAPLLWNRWDEIETSGDVRYAIRRRFHTVVDTAGLDEDRARDWVIIRMLVNVMWSMDADPSDRGAQEWVTNNITIAKAVQE